MPDATALPDPDLSTVQLKQSISLQKSLHEAVVALQSGDRPRAHQLFNALTVAHYQDENVWIGLALSSDDKAEAENAVSNAKLINPDSAFVKRAASEVARRFSEGGADPGDPGLAAAADLEQLLTDPPVSGAAAPLASAEPEEPAAPVVAAASPAVNQLEPRAPLLISQPARRPRRFLASFALLLLLGLLLGGVVYGLLLSNIFTPQPPAPVPVAPSPAPTLVPTVVAQLPAPHVFVPPTLPPTATPTSVSGVSGAAPNLQAERQIAMQAVRAGQYSVAIPLLEVATARNPDDAEALYYLGVAYLGDSTRPTALQDALFAFQSLTQLRPDWATGYYMLARTNIARGFERDAIDPAKRATELDPSKSEYWLVLAEANRAAGYKDEAAAAEVEAARHAPAALITPGTSGSSGGIADVPIAPLEATPSPTGSANTVSPTPVPLVQPVPSGVPGESVVGASQPAPAEGLITPTLTAVTQSPTK